MAKKLKALATSDDKQLAEVVRASAQQIWQAGLGAFAKAQEEGGRVFAKLVKDGAELQKRTLKMAKGAPEMTETISKVRHSIGKQAAGSWDRFELVFEDRVSRSLKSLGVPTQSDILALTRRIEELSNAVADLSTKKPAAKRVSLKTAAKIAAKKTARKASVKKAVRGTTTRASTAK